MDEMGKATTTGCSMGLFGCCLTIVAMAAALGLAVKVFKFFAG